MSRLASLASSGSRTSAERPPSARAPEGERAAIGLDQIADDGEAQPGAGLGLVQPPAAGEHGIDLVLGHARPIVLDRER